MFLSVASDITRFINEVSYDELKVLFVQLPGAVFILSCLLFVPFLTELTGILYLYTGKAKHFFITISLVTAKVFIMLFIFFEGGKGV